MGAAAHASDVADGPLPDTNSARLTVTSADSRSSMILCIPILRDIARSLEHYEIFR